MESHDSVEMERTTIQKRNIQMKNLIKKLIDRKAIILSLLTCVLSYCISNIKEPIIGETLFIQYVELFKNIFNGGEITSDENSDYVFVNVSYDRSLAEFRDPAGNLEGNIDITDRRKLCDLLSVLSISNCKHIMLDVSLDQHYKTQYDDRLNSLIRAIPNISTALKDHSEDYTPGEKEYYTNHNINAIDDSFNKVALLWGKNESLPYHVFKEVTHKQLNSIFGIFYYCDGQPARRCVYPKMYFSSEDTYYYNMGQDLLNKENYSVEDVQELVEGKIVIIGSFGGSLDKHNTYNVESYGAIINANILKSLFEESYVYPLWFIIFQFLLFYICGLFIFEGIFIASEKSRIHRLFLFLSKTIWLNYTIVIGHICVILYLFTGQAYDILITSTFLSIIHWTYKHIKKIRK